MFWYWDAFKNQSFWTYRDQETNEVVVQEQARDSEAVPEGDQQTTTVEVTEQGQENQGQAQTGSPITGQETKADSLKRGRENISEQVQESTTRLRNFVEQASKATLSGDVFDDAATGQGLLNFFFRALNSGAIDPEDVENAGVTVQEVQVGSFRKIVEARR